jgi:SAM-dependent methyltransferase
MVADPPFRPDLFRGTARSYDEFRLPYPQALIADLADRCGADGTGTLLDLACGTGQLAFPLRSRFGEVWAVDLEPDMIDFVRRTAQAAGDAGVRAMVSAAEDLSVPPGSVRLVTIGNAFHRMRRAAVAGRVHGWLRPGGWLALVWGGSPLEGDTPWQTALAALVRDWRQRADPGRVPAGWELARQATTDQEILRAAGFELAGRRSFESVHDWSPGEIAGYLASTSVLSQAALGGLAADFDRELRAVLTAAAARGPLRQRLSHAYDLARRPDCGR